MNGALVGEIKMIFFFHQFHDRHDLLKFGMLPVMLGFNRVCKIVDLTFGQAHYFAHLPDDRTLLETAHRS
ncbi:hypothetical protein D9M68_634820 [compost metagenome]